MPVTYGQYLTAPGLKAGSGSLASYQYYVVRAGSTAGTIAVAVTAATDPIIGILQNDPAAGEAAEVAVSGVCWALAEASVAPGDVLTCSSTGRVKTTTTNLDQAVGKSLCNASTSAGDLIPIIVSLFQVSDS